MEKSLALFTDLYEVTMAQAYFKTGNVKATFELFVRRLPPNRGYLVAAGLEDVCNYLLNFRFEKDDLEFLEEKGFEKDFLKFLSRIRFTGDMWALPEGELVFQNEPIIRVTAPIIEAQFLETFMINTVNFQTLIATKAARIVGAAKGRQVVDFGSRRAHGVDAGIKAARASYIGGCVGTSNVLAGKKYGIPVYGTMAHSYVEAFPSEKEAFKAWLKTWGTDTVLLVDTYDTLRGVRNAIEAVEELTGKKELKGIRMDSGDMLSLSKEARRILDEAGFNSTKIFVSSGLDEYVIEDYLNKGAQIDVFGVGSSLVTSDDAPKTDMVYKLVESEENGMLVPRMKIAEGEKATLPGAKQVYRVEENGRYVRDMVGLCDENLEGEGKLVQIFKNGRLVYRLPKLEEIREKARMELEKLPEEYKRIRSPEAYPVQVSERIMDLGRQLVKRLLSVKQG
ncbi:MAG: nicotinate phosphoribosyltransferase [Candidatus Brockarchaeota archaeon]|nr:nicotinate phosphoribosyltransferase [Candidatus Brockarchaeota archaeon]